MYARLKQQNNGILLRLLTECILTTRKQYLIESFSGYRSLVQSMVIDCEAIRISIYFLGLYLKSFKFGALKTNNNLNCV